MPYNHCIACRCTHCPILVSPVFTLSVAGLHTARSWLGPVFTLSVAGLHTARSWLGPVFTISVAGLHTARSWLGPVFTISVSGRPTHCPILVRPCFHYLSQWQAYTLPERSFGTTSFSSRHTYAPPLTVAGIQN